MPTEHVPEPLNELPDRHGAHRERLYELFDQGDSGRPSTLTKCQFRAGCHRLLSPGSTETSATAAAEAGRRYAASRRN